MRRTWIIALVALLFSWPSLVGAEKIGLYQKKGPVGIGGWVVFWDANNASLVSFEKHADQVDRAYFEWYNLHTDDCMPHPIDSATPELKARAIAAAKKNNVEMWEMIGNYNIKINDHDKTMVEPFLYDSAMRAKHIQILIDNAVKDGVKGIQIDYENILAKDKQPFSNFMKELKAACAVHGLYCGVALPAKTDAVGTWDDPQSRDYGAIGKATDQFVPMTYDYHWGTGGAGCVTSPEWAEMVVKYSITVMDPDKLEVGYPTYGYDWIENVGETITYQDFMERAKKYHVQPERGTDYSQELHYDYTDEKGNHHSAWMPDSRSLTFQCDIVKRYHLYGIGIWRFGAEDESFWTTMKKINSTPQETSGLLEPESTPITGKKLLPIEFITDAQGTMYQYAYPADTTKISTLVKQGKRWVDMRLRGDDYSGVGIGVDRKNLMPYLKKGALQFYIRGNKGGEALSGVGFLMDKGLKDDEKYNFENTVPLGNYCRVTTRWQLITIPLADFPGSGHRYDMRNGQTVNGSFKWDRVIEFNLDHAPASDPKLEIQISSVRVVPGYNARKVQRTKEALEQ
jgi:spore germination protein YaaH